MRRGRSHAVGALVALCGLALAATACGEDGNAVAPEKVSASGVYAAVIRSLLLPPTEGQLPKDRHVYVVARGAGVKVGLDVQANVVRKLEGEAKVQWVDDPDEALRDEGDGGGVRDDGIVVGLGPVPMTTPPVEVYADRATDRGTVEAFLSTVTLQGETWVVVSQTATEPQR